MSIPSRVSYEKAEELDVEFSLIDTIIETARLHGIDENKFLYTAECESSLNPSAIGDGGNSIGLFQIHLPSHPSVTKELALDAQWAIRWSAEKFREDPTIWVCYNKLYGTR